MDKIYIDVKCGGVWWFIDGPMGGGDLMYCPMGVDGVCNFDDQQIVENLDDADAQRALDVLAPK